jgi:hypothetical protein
MQKPEWDDRLSKAVGDAFDETIRMLNAENWPSRLKEIVAREMIQVARMGERDPGRLCERVFRRLSYEPGMHAARSQDCLRRSALSRIQSERAQRPNDKEDFIGISEVWRGLAGSFEVVERTRAYLAVAHQSLNPLQTEGRPTRGQGSRVVMRQRARPVQ